MGYFCIGYNYKDFSFRECFAILRRIFFSVFILFFIFITTAAHASSPSNAGYLGLWEYPTAQMPGDGKGRIGWSSYEPYRAWYANLGYFPWMEFNLRLTRFATGPTISEGYGRYKDKAIDLKFLMFQQEEFRPSVAFGVTDILGTEIMQSYYSVATYEWDNFALTWGYGTDRLNGYFGGISWQALDWLELKAEYSPLDYNYDTVGGKRILEEDPDQKWNAGFVAETPWGVDVSASYQRGNEFCFALSYNLDLTNPIFGGNKPEYKGVPTEDMKVPDWENAHLEEVALEIVQSAGAGSGVRDVEVFMGERKVMIAYENMGYSSQGEAMARMMVLASSLLPWDVDEVIFVVKLRGRFVTMVRVPGYQCGLLRLRDISYGDLNGSEVSWFNDDLLSMTKWEVKAGPGETEVKGRNEIKAMLVYEPRVDRTLEEDYMARWSVDWIYRMRSSQGWEGFLDIRQPVENDIDIYWEPETNDETRIWKGVVSYLHRVNENIFGIAEAGWLDAQWFGGNAWLRFFSQNGRWWVGGRTSVVHERDPYEFASLAEEPVNFRDSGRITVGDRGYDGEQWWWEYWLQAGYHDPVYDLDLNAEYGVYIDGDWGFTLSAMRWWNDLAIGFWISRTDNLTVDKDFSNAGMTLEIPVDAWWGASSAHVFSQEFSLLSTWNYYAARQPGAWQTPEQLIRQVNPDVLGGNLYAELGRFCALAEGEVVRKERCVYGLYDYLSGNYRY